MNKLHGAASIALILGAITGLAMIVLTPPFQVPDEEAHFFRAYQVSTLNLSLEKRNGRVGAELPVSISNTHLLFKDIILNESCKTDLSRYRLALGMTDNRPEFCTPILPYPPAAYIAQAFGIFLGRIAGAPPIIYFYLGRVLNLALFLFLAITAIRLLPFMKWGLALLVLMPMTLYEAASLSADAFTIGIAFFMIALFLHCAAGNGPLSAGDIALMFAGTVLLALTKQGYSPLVFLALLIPAHRFGTPRRKAFVMVGLIVVAIVIGITCILSIREFSVGLPGSNSSEQLRYILSHPLTYLTTLFRCFFRASQFGSFIGWFGWLETRLPIWIIVPYGLLLLAVPLAEKRIFVLSRRQRYLIGSLFGFLVILIFTIQYLSWTPVGKRSIDSVQGRYFIPFAPLFLILFNSRRFSFSMEDNAVARRLLVGFIVFVHVVSAGMLLDRYYPLGR
jgi:uncharacterized membrane protein